MHRKAMLTPRMDASRAGSVAEALWLTAFMMPTKTAVPMAPAMVRESAVAPGNQRHQTAPDGEIAHYV